MSDGDLILWLREKYANYEITKEELLSYSDRIPLAILEGIILDYPPRDNNEEA